MELRRPQTEQIVQRPVRDSDGASTSVGGRRLRSASGSRLLRPFGALPPPAAGVDGRGEKRFKAVIRRAEGLFVKNNHTFIDQYQGRDEIDAEINAHGIQSKEQFYLGAASKRRLLATARYGGS